MIKKTLKTRYLGTGREAELSPGRKMLIYEQVRKPL